MIMTRLSPPGNHFTSSYTDPTNGTTYRFTVVAVDAGGNVSARSATVTVVPASSRTALTDFLFSVTDGWSSRTTSLKKPLRRPSVILAIACSGLPSLRVRGLYFVLSTMAVHYLVVYVFLEYQLKFFDVVGVPYPNAALFGWEIFTAITQSSSVVTIATIGFVNAGRAQLLGEDGLQKFIRQ